VLNKRLSHEGVPTALPGGKSPLYPLEGGWVGPRAGLHDMERVKILPLLELELRFLDRQVRSQSLYRLLYEDNIKMKVEDGCVGVDWIHVVQDRDLM
jgi:hypothetical protein